MEDGNQSTIMTVDASCLRGCEAYLNACGVDHRQGRLNVEDVLDEDAFVHDV